MRLLVVSATLLLSGVGLILPAAAAADARLVDIRIGKRSSSETRVVFESTVRPVVTLQTAETDTSRQTNDLTVFFANKNLAPTSLPQRGWGTVEGVIAGAKVDQGLAYIIEFGAPTRIKDVFVLEPKDGGQTYRLVLDFEKGPPGALVASIPDDFQVKSPRYSSITDVIEQSLAGGKKTPPDWGEVRATRPLQVTDETSVKARKRVIVLDAGHGGSDPGAIGAKGTKEADVTLRAATTLGKILEKTDRYEVVFTRKGNERLALEQRAPIARKAKAELFLSLHADALRDKSVRGASVYTLSEEGNVRSAKEAARSEDYRVFDLDMAEQPPEVGGILFDLAQRRTGNESARFADVLIGKLAGVTPLLNNTHRRENLRVLLAPDVPAVLLELAFMSNVEDEINLRSQDWHDRTMAAVAVAIDSYFDNLDNARHAANTQSR
ncbi:MAG: N-acetylmuramoyl-L-alanine amidase [Pseudomonadota bacterium]